MKAVRRRAGRWIGVESRVASCELRDTGKTGIAQGAKRIEHVKEFGSRNTVAGNGKAVRILAGDKMQVSGFEFFVAAGKSVDTIFVLLDASVTCIAQLITRIRQSAKNVSK